MLLCVVNCFYDICIELWPVMDNWELLRSSANERTIITDISKFQNTALLSFLQYA